MQAGIFIQVILPLSLFIIMLGMGLALKPADFTRVVQEPKAITIGILCQMVLLPLIGFFVVTIFGLKQELAVGLMILAFCPGGTTSNLMSYLARGDVALSISLTAVVSLLTPFTIPVLTVLMIEFFLDNPQNFDLPVLKTIIQLMVITVVPVSLGMFINFKSPKFSARAEKPIKIFSIVFLFIIIAGIAFKNRADMVNFFVQAGAASLSLNILALLVGYLVAKFAGLNKRQTVTMGIEVGIQNGTIALLVSGTLLGNALMTIPAVSYSLIMFATGAAFAWLVNRSHNTEENHG